MMDPGAPGTGPRAVEAAWIPPRGLACPACGYALGGAVGGACPECGQPVGPEDVGLAARRETYMAATKFRTEALVGGTLTLLAVFTLPLPRKEGPAAIIALASAAVGLGAAALLPRGRGLAPRAARRLWWSLWPLTQAGAAALLAVEPVTGWLEAQMRAADGVALSTVLAVYVAVVLAGGVMYFRRVRTVAATLGVGPTLRASRWTLAACLAMAVPWACAFFCLFSLRRF